MKIKYLTLLGFFFINYSVLISQTNLEICYQLINRSVKSIDSVLNKNDDAINLDIILPSSYEELKPYIINSFLSNGFNLLKESSEVNLIYVLTDVNVRYKNINQINFFSDDKLIREISITGSTIFINKSKQPHKFYYNYSDTVKYNDLESLENSNLKFTQGKIPEQPVLKNLIQPIIIVGVLISTVILFFTVRSK